jgi:prepilin-type N-terminal cleavage/methylation domain-containing protein
MTDTRVRAAFTAIELLAVMAIVTIMAGLATPALQQATRRADVGRATALIESSHAIARTAAQTRGFSALGGGAWQPVLVSLNVTAHGVRVLARSGASYAAARPYDDAATPQGAEVIHSADFPSGITAWAVDATGASTGATAVVYYCAEDIGGTPGPGNGRCDGDSGTGLAVNPTPVSIHVGMLNKRQLSQVDIHFNGTSHAKRIR